VNARLPNAVEAAVGPSAAPRKSAVEGGVRNALTVDVEDYFQVSAFAPYVERSSWDRLPCRVEGNVDRILMLLEAAGAHATFFTLGWVAQRYPALVRRIAAGGHEVASHGFAHRRVTEQQPKEFLADIRLAKAVLEDVAQSAVLGYRAPSFSIGRANAWAFDCIKEAGYRYSSSLYPIRHDHYGEPGGARFAHAVLPDLLEVPISTVRLLETNWPAGGGGYFRLLPYRVSKWSVGRVNAVDRRPAMFYFHPWELDPGQPRMPGPGLKTRFRHYVNLRRMERKVQLLLEDFRWDRADRVFLHPAN
jgi:polysaccharide deacetylase family protein (PEP-CTERM system associated)